MSICVEISKKFNIKGPSELQGYGPWEIAVAARPKRLGQKCIRPKRPVTNLRTHALLQFHVKR